MKYQSFIVNELGSELARLKGLLQIDAPAGTVRFGGERAILFGSAALGMLRHHVVRHFGVAAARTMFTQLGFAHGWRMADAVRQDWAFASTERWRAAGGYVHMLQGHMRLDDNAASPLSDDGSSLSNSYEAEEHAARLGCSNEPVCWTLCGIASGYLSRTENTRIYVLEDRCVARGDPVCRFRGKTRGGWGTELTPHLRFFQIDDFDSVLEELAVELGRGEPEPAERALGGLLVRSAPMREVVARTRRIALTDLSVLIQGESGVGKEGIARLIHRSSRRAGGPFVAVNCAAIPESLLESELFGHARGAFTGAVGERVGLFGAAAGGTVFLDEVGELPLSTQAKLLRVLEERALRRVGESREMSIDVRVVSATKRDLAAEIRAGRFRDDLYYRLNAIDIVIPPLRQRRDDILPIAESVLFETCSRLKREQLVLGDDLKEHLLRYSWPGNVRELRNMVERAAVLAWRPVLELSDIPELLRTYAASLPESGAVKTLEVFERDYILAVLAGNGGNQVRTAAQLGIAESTLYRKLKSYGGIVTPRNSRPPSR